ncbi:MAG: universal stress protein [Pseudomonadota bacterium]
MHIQKLLFVTTFTDLSFDALESLLGLRQTGLDHVVFLNVIDREKVAMRRGAGYDKKEETKLREVANIRFIDWAESLFEQGMEVGVYIVVGNLVQQVVRSAKNENADIVVIGRRKTGPLRQFFSGSDLGAIIRRTGKPVMVYNYRQDAAAMENPFTRPLLAVSAQRSAGPAIALLKAQKEIISSLHVIHVASEKSLTESSAMDIQRTRKEARRQMDDICGQFAQAGIDAEPHVYIGNPGQEIEKATRELRSSLLVVGAGEKGKWLGRRVKNVATELCEQLNLPILMVPPV